MGPPLAGPHFTTADGTCKDCQVTKTHKVMDELRIEKAMINH